MIVENPTIIKKIFTDDDGLSWYTVTHSNKKGLKNGTIVDDRKLYIIEPYKIEGEDDGKDN